MHTVMNIEQSHVQRAALRASSVLVTKIKAALPSNTAFDLFEFATLISDVPCIDQKEFFQDLEDCATKFFMEWFGADNTADFSVRRRIALQGIKDTIDPQFWKNIESLSELSRQRLPVEAALEPYEKAIKKEKKSMFGMLFADNFYKNHDFLTEAKQKGGVVCCDKEMLLGVTQRQFVVDLTKRFNEILTTVNITKTFAPSPSLLPKSFEKRVLEQREKSSIVGIVRPPVRPPVQVSY